MNEQILTPEQHEEIETTISLDFMRHGEKEKDPNKTDEEMRLTPKGRSQGVTKGKQLNPKLDISVGKGSLRKRTQETALHAMLSGQEGIDPDATLEEMVAEINKSMKYGKKLVVDKRLNFDISGPIGLETLAASKAGVYLGYLVEKSDQRALETGDLKSTTLIRQAGNIAELLKDYTKVGNNFQRIANLPGKELGDRLERYLGTHGGVTESFVIKALEKTQGIKARDEFVKAAGGGFAETEGIHVDIINKGENQTIKVTYPLGDRKETIEITTELLEEIIKDRAEFEKAVLEKAK
jgi:hypothetical protein